MSTDDVTTFSASCPCGEGRIVVTRTEPDHPWVRASQIHYHGQLECDACLGNYAIENGYSGTKPRLVVRADLEAKAGANVKVQLAEENLEGAPDLSTIRLQLIALIDSEPTKAAKHRLLGKLGFWSPSYGTFIKGATDGVTLLKRASAHAVVQAGIKARISEAMSFKGKLDEIAALKKRAHSINVNTVPTGAYWMQA